MHGIYSERVVLCWCDNASNCPERPNLSDEYFRCVCKICVYSHPAFEFTNKNSDSANARPSLARISTALDAYVVLVPSVTAAFEKLLPSMMTYSRTDDHSNEIDSHVLCP